MAAAPATRRAKDRSISKILALAASYLAEKGCSSARLDAELLLAHALGCDRMDLYLDYHRPLEEGELEPFRVLITKRASGVPAARLLGFKEFWSMRLELNKDTLIPRPETELLVERTLERVRIQRLEEPRILEIGTGAGGVAIALAKELPRARITATDISETALSAAKKNSERLGVAGRIEFSCGDMFEPVQAGNFDLVLMNPPYLTTDELARAQIEVRMGDPSAALDGGPDGLGPTRRLLGGAGSVLVPGGYLLVEITPARCKQVCESAEVFGFSLVAVHKDLAGLERLVEVRAQI